MTLKKRLGFIMMVGASNEANPAIELMQSARRAAALDSLAAAQDTGLFDELIVVTNDPRWKIMNPFACILDLDDPGEPFHFGRRLSQVIERQKLTHVFYMGAGAAPLLGENDLSDLVRTLMAKSAIVITNNLHSSDWAAFSPASVISSYVHRIERDNALGWVLHREAGLPFEALPASAASRLDIDTPTDLLVLTALSGGGDRLKAELLERNLDASRMEKAVRVMATDGTNLIVAGRVASTTWA
ncbi:MAG: hypothetical protein JXA42_12835, partial [Anaerolineales bacterium]|nr:hypothetical protein [Anaerolineales bacterium]